MLPAGSSARGVGGPGWTISLLSQDGANAGGGDGENGAVVQMKRRKPEAPSGSSPPSPGKDGKSEPNERGRGIPISMLVNEDADAESEPQNPEPQKRSPVKSRPRWTPEEDQLLRELVASGQKLSWSELAKHFKSKRGKQVRLRWVDHLDPSIVRQPWTEEEDNKLLRGHEQYGNSWSRIAKSLPGRSDAMTKNRFYQLARTGGVGSSRTSSQQEGSRSNQTSSTE